MGKIRKELFIKHDVTALRDEKILMLLKKHGHVGYSIYWRLLEQLYQTDFAEIQLDKVELISEPLLMSDYKDVQNVLDTCIQIGLFLKTEDGAAFYSERLKADRGEVEAISEKRRESINKRWKSKKDTNEIQLNNNCNTNEVQLNNDCNTNKNKKENNKESKKENKKDTDNKTNNNVSCIEQTSLLPAGSTADSNDILLADDSTQYTDFTLPLNDGSLYHVTKADFEQWQKIYPAVDVAQQLRQMSAWSDANPKKRKTSKGVKSFIVSWLGKEQDRGASSYTATQPQRKKAWTGSTKTSSPVKAPSVEDIY